MLFMTTRKKQGFANGKPLLFYTLIIVVIVLFILAVVLVVFILAIVLIVLVLAVILLIVLLIIVLTVVLSVIHLYHHLFGNDIMCSMTLFIQTQWLFVCANSRENIANCQYGCPQSNIQQEVERNRHQKSQ